MASNCPAIYPSVVRDIRERAGASMASTASAGIGANPVPMTVFYTHCLHLSPSYTHDTRASMATSNFFRSCSAAAVLRYKRWTEIVSLRACHPCHAATINGPSSHRDFHHTADVSEVARDHIKFKGLHAIENIFEISSPVRATNFYVSKDYVLARSHLLICR